MSRDVQEIAVTFLKKLNFFTLRCASFLLVCISISIDPPKHPSPKPIPEHLSILFYYQTSVYPLPSSFLYSHY